MARLTEDQIKELLNSDGFSVGDFFVITNVNQIENITNSLKYPLVLKALVPTGKRGKAGAIQFAEDKKEALEKAKKLFSIKVKNYPVKKILLEKKVDIQKELYLSFSYDHTKQIPIAIASTEGGVDIEEVNSIQYKFIDPIIGFNPYQARELWIDLGVKGKLIQLLGNITYKLYLFFEKYDAYILEINPLSITKEGETVIVGTLMGIDDAAVFRQKNVAPYIQLGAERYWKPLTEREKKAVEVNETEPYRGTARYTEMEKGDIGFMCGGGGGSLLLFDALLKAGGKPANYSEFGGNPSAVKIYGLCKVILSKPNVKGLFVAQNITNNTQVDLVAEGVVKAIRDLNIDTAKFPIVVREAGVNEEKAKEIFKSAGIEYYNDDITLNQAAKRMVEKMKGVY